MTVEIRPAQLADVASLERRCWPGGEDEMCRRIESQGTCSIIALDSGRPVAQLYLRPFELGFRAPKGLHDGGWWADLAGLADEGVLPAGTAMLGCWHVGRVREQDGSECEATEYRGHGIGTALLEHAVAWLHSGEGPFDALAAKAADTESPAYLGWLGGLPHSIFEAHGFRRLTTFDDPYLLAEPQAVPSEAAAVSKHPARFHLMAIERR